MGKLAYDADCGFCTRYALWAGDAVPWQSLDLDDVGATPAQAVESAAWLEEGRVVAWGASAIAFSLIARGGVTALAGRILRLPGVRRLADVSYAWIGVHRDRMPGGGTSACRVEREGPPRLPLIIVGYLVILIAGLASLGATNREEEPYPALVMPGFGYVAERAGKVLATEVVYYAVDSAGATREVNPDLILPEGSNGYVAARRSLHDETIAQARETAAWLRDRVPSGVVEVRIEWHLVSIDTANRKSSDLGAIRTVKINLRPQP